MELDYKAIGRNVRHYRIKMGYKQKELAEKINLTDQHISHIETGSTQLSLPTLIAICNALDVDCNTLLGGNLSGKAEMEALGTELEEMLFHLKGDKKRLRLCVDFCRLIIDAEL